MCGLVVGLWADKGVKPYGCGQALSPPHIVDGDCQALCGLLCLSRNISSHCRGYAQHRNHADHSCSAGHPAGSERQLILCSSDTVRCRQSADHQRCGQQRQHGRRGAKRARVCCHRNALLQLFTVLQQGLQHYILPLWMKRAPGISPLGYPYIYMPRETRRLGKMGCQVLLRLVGCCKYITTSTMPQAP